MRHRSGPWGKGAPLRPPDAVREADRCGPRGAGLGRIQPVPRSPISIPADAHRRAALNKSNRRSDSQRPRGRNRNRDGDRRSARRRRHRGTAPNTNPRGQSPAGHLRPAGLGLRRKRNLPTTREPHRDRTRGRAHERPRPQRPPGARGSHAGVESARNLNIYL